MIGTSETAARYAGMDIRRNIYLVMFISGAICGLAGMAEVSGITGRLQHGRSPGYGYTALAIPGVAAVLTHRDVPGLNGYGIAVQDQPVLCCDKVCYLGDAVALVAAESRQLVEEALAAIRVDYEPLASFFPSAPGQFQPWFNSH